MSVSGLCQMLVRTVRDDTVRQRRRTRLLIRRLVAELIRRDVYKKKEALLLAGKLMEQEQ